MIIKLYICFHLSVKSHHNQSGVGLSGVSHEWAFDLHVIERSHNLSHVVQNAEWVLLEALNNNVSADSSISCFTKAVNGSIPRNEVVNELHATSSSEHLESSIGGIKGMVNVMIEVQTSIVFSVE